MQTLTLQTGKTYGLRIRKNGIPAVAPIRCLGPHAAGGYSVELVRSNYVGRQSRLSVSAGLFGVTAKVNTTPRNVDAIGNPFRLTEYAVYRRIAQP